MTKEQVARINELARKKKTVGLTESEVQEQAELRAQYLKDFREGFRQQLDNTYIQYEDGTKVKLQQKHNQ
ncbi:MAG: DUF896 domain-containing protein [Clostridia bacterium]|nr:DUF896 domain-containing protein [Clostridia bacterium]